MLRYKAFNEARKHKQKQRKRGGVSRHHRQQDQQNNWKPNVPRFAEVRGMPMHYSPKFKYVIEKIAGKGNLIAKEILNLQNKPDAKFEYSYLDLYKTSDSLTYLPNGAKDIPDEEKYKNNKRQVSKVYKIIKTIFGSRFTKTEVNKFVSFYKEIYEKGPDRPVEQVPFSKPKLAIEETIKKITDDTASDKLKWSHVEGAGNLNRFETRVNITKNKYLSLIFYYFNRGDKKQINISMLIVNIFNSSAIDEKEQRKWIETYQYKDIVEFIDIFDKKYNLDSFQ